MKVLLVEPDYNSKYPPLGLLKIGTYHSNRGDEVRLVRGKIKEPSNWDRIYITALFSFYHDKIIDTILYYKDMVGNDLSKIFLGGAYATLFPDVFFSETGVYPTTGLVNSPNQLGLGDQDATVDSLIPDYSLLSELDYDYGLKDCYFGYATRGCIRKCPFCAVWRLEPEYNSYTGLKCYIKEVNEKYGERQNMVLMDNNVLASNSFERIIEDLVELGFARNAKRNHGSRFIDFNQGLDARLVDKKKAKLLAKICLKPVRLAYDHTRDHKIFERAVRYLADEGFTDFSTYILYNYEDTPSDFYNRLAHCNDLNQKFNIAIYSFPMRYTPLGQRDRTFVGSHWNKKFIRGLQCILNVTRGTVSPGNGFFLRAFGHSAKDFEEICAMPDEYILYRDRYEHNQAEEWRNTFRSLTPLKKKRFFDISCETLSNVRKIQEALEKIKDSKIRKLLEAFITARVENGKK